jgi:hypothetical protein
MSDIDHTLQALGFVADSNGVLAAPAGSRVTLTPISQFYELRVSLGDGNAVVAVLAKSAVKISREGATSSPEIDVDALISGPKRRPW